MIAVLREAARGIGQIALWLVAIVAAYWAAVGAYWLVIILAVHVVSWETGR
jgi:hypothetical protein